MLQVVKPQKIPTGKNEIVKDLLYENTQIAEELRAFLVLLYIQRVANGFKGGHKVIESSSQPLLNSSSEAKFVITSSKHLVTSWLV